MTGESAPDQFSVTAGGATIPALGFGTARMDDYGTQRRAVEAALEAGYRHVDTAQTYDSESAVGDAIEDSAVDRDDVFLTTKLAGENRVFDRVKSSTSESLDLLNTDYVDLLLVHWPNDLVPQEETLAAMNELREEGVVRHVGVSNFSVAQLEAAVSVSNAPIVTNQVEYHVRHRQDELLEWCLDHDVLLTAYSPLDVGRLATDPDLDEIGKRYGKTAAQVAIRWLLDQPNVATIPMSSSPAHVRENVDVFDFELTSEELFEVFELDGPLALSLRAHLDE